MSQQDPRGNPISGSSPEVEALFEQGLVEFQSYFGDPTETMDAALAIDPGFIMGHLLRANALAALGEAQFLPEIRKNVEAAEAGTAKATERERMLTHAARLWLDGDWEAAVQGWEQVLVEYPRDVLALQTAHLADFLRGDALNLRDRVNRVLPHWSEDVPGYSYVLGMQAFGYEECNQYPLAEETAHRALALEPRDPWAIHAMAHVLEMQNRYDEGIDWFTSREADWAPDNGFAFHNWWHLALYHIERNEYAQALSIWDRHISPETADIAMPLLDATAFLWRLQLMDVDVGDRWSEIADMWERKMGEEAAYYPFNDMHALMSMAATGRSGAARELAERISAAHAAGTSANHAMLRDVGLPVAWGFLAFAEQDYRRAVECLVPIRHVANRFGGSHAQRDVISLTVLEAAIRAGDEARARSLLNERLAHKPRSPLAWRISARFESSSGRPDAACQAAGHAESLIRPRAAA